MTFLMSCFHLPSNSIAYIAKDKKLCLSSPPYTLQPLILEYLYTFGKSMFKTLQVCVCVCVSGSVESQG